MQRLLARRPSPAMVVALLALFVALGGSSYAALNLPRNSVGSRQLERGAVTRAKLHRNAVTSGKVKDHSLLARDFKTGQLPLGAQGPPGPQGPAGPASGPAGGDLTGSYPDPSIAPGAVTNSKLAHPSLTIGSGTGLSGGGLVALGGATALSVSDGGIGTNQLAAGAVTTSKFDPGAVAPEAAGVDALFGDGSDGDVVIGSDTTLTRDTYYRDLTIAPGVTLNPGGFRIFVSGTLTLGDQSAIARNGNDVVDFNDAPGLSAGTLGEGGGANTSENNSLGGSGGFNGASATPPTAAAGGDGVFRQALAALSGRSLDGAIVNGGAGGRDDCGNLPCRGGGGGGVVVVIARTVAVSSGTARVTATGGSDGGTGGGGGGGGVAVVISSSPQPPGLTLSAVGGHSDNGGGGAGFTDWLS